MKANERFIASLKGLEKDRMSLTENSAWWYKTIGRWQSEGMKLLHPYDGTWRDILYIQEMFGLDKLAQWWVRPYTDKTPVSTNIEEGYGAVDLETYEKVFRPTMYPEPKMEDDFITEMKKLHSRGEVTLELIMNGAFWEPRTLMGVERHLLSFYDQPELYEIIVSDMINWQKKVIEYVTNTLKFDWVTIAEDMSYNLGSMISKNSFEQFLTPYYNKIVPILKAADLFVTVDSDGDIVDSIEWFNSCGVEGYHPLEKQAGVDINKFQKIYPETAFIGNFDKMIMHKGENALRQEFERITPAIKKGKYIISCDHQTPPSVSIDDYKLYIKLLREYSKIK